MNMTGSRQPAGRAAGDISPVAAGSSIVLRRARPIDAAVSSSPWPGDVRVAAGQRVGLEYCAHMVALGQMREGSTAATQLQCFGLT